MPDRTARVLLSFEVEQQKLQKTLSSITNLEKNFLALSGDVEATSKTMQRLKDSGDSIRRITAAGEIGRQFAQLADDGQNSIDVLQQMLGHLKDIGASEDQIGRATRAFNEYRKAIKDANEEAGKIPAPEVPNAPPEAGGRTRSGRRLVAESIATNAAQILPGGAGDVARAASDVLGVNEALSGLGAAAPVAAGALVIFSVAMKAVQDAFDKGKAAVDSYLSAQRGELDMRLRNVDVIKTASSEALRAQADTQKKQADIVRAELEERRANLENIKAQYDALGAAFDPLQRSALGQVGQQLEQDITKLEDQQRDLAREYENTTNVLIPAVEARERENKALEDNKKLLEEREKKLLNEREQDAQSKLEGVRLLQQARQLDAQGVRDLIQQRRDEITALQSARFELKQSDPLYAEYTNRIRVLQTEINSLSSAVLPGKEAIERFNDLMGKLTQGAQQAQNAVSGFLDGIIKRTAAINAQLASARQSYEKDVEKIDEQAYQRRAAAQERYNEALVSAAEQAADGAAKALQTLERRRAELTLNNTREGEKAERDKQAKELDIRIKAARTEAKALREHADELIKIRKDAQAREEDMLLNRDFRSVYQSRLDTTRQLEEAGTTFTNQRREREISQNEEFADLQRSLQREADERRIALEQRRDDLKKSYDDEIADIEASRQKAITKAQADRTRELSEAETQRIKLRNIRRQQYIDELKLATQTEADKLRIQNQYAAKARADLIAVWSAGISHGGGGGGRVGAISKFASGGHTSAGKWIEVNEPGSSGMESFTTGGKTFALPGRGYFMPLSGGVVNANKNLGGVQLTINVNESSSPRLTAEAIRPMVLDVLDEIVA